MNKNIKKIKEKITEADKSKKIKFRLRKTKKDI